jgi:two-component sensor histidine kinase
VEVDKIADSTLYSSLLLFLLFCLIGAGTSFILFNYPSGIIKAAESRIEEMIALLKVEIKERTTKEAALAESLEEKEILLREIHHRVKNNLQLIASLLSLRMNRLDKGETRELLQNIKYKIYAMARVHEHLYQDSSLSVIDMGSYIDTIVKEIRDYEENEEEMAFISYSVDSAGISLSLDRAMPVGLIVNELLINSQKYAFPGRTEGHIEVRLERTEEGRARLTVSDDGIGMPLEKADSRGNNLGFLLVRSLTAQLGGELKLESSCGLKVVVDGIKIAD